MPAIVEGYTKLLPGQARACSTIYVEMDLGHALCSTRVKLVLLSCSDEINRISMWHTPVPVMILFQGLGSYQKQKELTQEKTSLTGEAIVERLIDR